MTSDRVAALSRSDILVAAEQFRWNRRMPKWTVIVTGREYPVRPLVLAAAGVPPNDPTNSHQAVQLLKNHGFEIRYQGRSETSDEKGVRSENRPTVAEMEDAITRLRGCCKGSNLVEVREREHRDDRF